jgi:hypothetical protein
MCQAATIQAAYELLGPGWMQAAACQASVGPYARQYAQVQAAGPPDNLIHCSALVPRYTTLHCYGALCQLLLLNTDQLAALMPGAPCLTWTHGLSSVLCNQGLAPTLVNFSRGSTSEHVHDRGLTGCSRSARVLAARVTCGLRESARAHANSTATIDMPVWRGP